MGVAGQMKISSGFPLLSAKDRVTQPSCFNMLSHRLPKKDNSLCPERVARLAYEVHEILLRKTDASCADSQLKEVASPDRSCNLAFGAAVESTAGTSKWKIRCQNDDNRHRATVLFVHKDDLSRQNWRMQA